MGKTSKAHCPKCTTLEAVRINTARKIKENEKQWERIRADVEDTRSRVRGIRPSDLRKMRVERWVPECIRNALGLMMVLFDRLDHTWPKIRDFLGQPRLRDAMANV